MSFFKDADVEMKDIVWAEMLRQRRAGKTPDFSDDEIELQHPFITRVLCNYYELGIVAAIRVIEDHLVNKSDYDETDFEF